MSLPYIAKHPTRWLLTNVEDITYMHGRLFHFHIVYTITPPVNEKINSCFKKEDGDDDGKQIVYNTVGPNVCMGDHKVKTGLCNILTLLLR